MIAPCKGCEERFIGCHSSCDGYAEWKGVEQLKKDALNDIRMKDEYFASRNYNAQTKQMKTGKFKCHIKTRSK